MTYEDKASYDSTPPCIRFCTYSAWLTSGACLRRRSASCLKAQSGAPMTRSPSSLRQTCNFSSNSCFVDCSAIHCNTATLQHACNTATLQHCNTATHLHQCNVLQHTATHCNTLQHTITHHNTLQFTSTVKSTIAPGSSIVDGHISYSRSSCCVYNCQVDETRTAAAWKVAAASTHVEFTIAPGSARPKLVNGELSPNIKRAKRTRQWILDGQVAVVSTHGERLIALWGSFG